MNNLDILTLFAGKVDGEKMPAANWNSLLSTLQTKVNELVANANSGSSSSSTMVSNFYVNGVLTQPTNGLITLVAGSTYKLEGTLYGQIFIDATTIKPTTNTILVFNGVTIISSLTSGIKYSTPTINTGYQDLVVSLNKDTINTVVCSTVVAVADNQEACIYSMNNLVIQGVGYLTVVNKGGHGIKGSELRITGPNIYAEASHDAIHGSSVLDLDYGTFFINGANDAFGTGDTGTINIFGGKYYAYNINEQIFDGKVKTNIFDKNHVISGTDVASGNQYTNKVLVYSNPVAYFGATSAGTVTEFLTVTKNDDGTWTGTGTVLAPDANGIYQISKPFIEIKGNILGAINIPTTVTDVLFRLENAYIMNSASLIPTFHYNTATDKIKFYCANDSINMIGNSVVGDITLYDLDAVKSENNISIEVKSGAHLLVEAIQDDGLDGGDVKVTDSKGVLICHNCGGRGIKGSCVIIGPNVETTKSVITSYYSDPTDTENYSTLEGAVLAVNNSLKHDLSIGIIPLSGSDVTYKNFGYADVYCRNGKYSKGTFGTYAGCLLGVFIFGSIGACVSMDFNKSKNIYYNKVVDLGSLGITADSGLTMNQYTCFPYGKAPMIK
jgi:hypothetical protein